MLLLIAVCVFVGITSLVLHLSSPKERPDLQRRIAGNRAGMLELSAAREPQRSEGLPQFVFGIIRRFLPGEIFDQVQADLVKAGNPTSLQTMILAWVIGILGLPIAYAILIFSRGTRVGSLQLVVLALIPILGFYMPRMWLKRKIARRRKILLKSLPDGIDLITTSVEAGLGIDAALARVADKVKGPLAEEFSRCLREMSLGRTRREALQDFADRVEIEDVTAFIGAVIQAEHTGVSLGHVIRIQAEQLRIKRKQRAEQAAYKAPVKMVIPLVLFIFPALFIVILGPAVIKVIQLNS